MGVYVFSTFPLVENKLYMDISSRFLPGRSETKSQLVLACIFVFFRNMNFIPTPLQVSVSIYSGHLRYSISVNNVNCVENEWVGERLWFLLVDFSKKREQNLPSDMRSFG